MQRKERNSASFFFIGLKESDLKNRMLEMASVEPISPLSSLKNVICAMKILIIRKNSPKKIFLAKYFTVTNKTLVFQCFIAMCTFQAFWMPVIVQYFQNEPIENEKTTTCTFRNGCCKRYKNVSMSYFMIIQMAFVFKLCCTANILRWYSVSAALYWITNVCLWSTQIYFIICL